MLELAVDDRGIPVLRVAHHVLPDVQDGAAGRVDERAALFRQRAMSPTVTPKAGRITTSFGPRRLPRFGRLAQESDAGGPQPIVDVGVVDDLAGQVDVLFGKSPPRLVGVVDCAVDAVAEPELAGEVHREPSDLMLEVVRPDLLDDTAVVGRGQFSGHRLFHVEALAEDEGLGLGRRSQTCYRGRSRSRARGVMSSIDRSIDSRSLDASRIRAKEQRLVGHRRTGHGNDRWTTRRL